MPDVRIETPPRLAPRALRVGVVAGNLAAAEAMRLTDDQATVVTADPGSRVLVLAGPGTGKTEVLARRLVYLLGRGLRPSQLLVLSFSRNAVKNVNDRVRRLSDIDEAMMMELRHLVVRTFDSWSFRVLRQTGESSADLLSGSHTGSIAKLVEKLRGESCERVLEHLEHIRHVIVDELQDLSGWRGELVMELLRQLCPKEKKSVGFTLLGDPAQAIYNFGLRGTEEDGSKYTAENLLGDIRRDYDGLLLEKSLSANFRSEKAIAKTVANARAILLGHYSAEQKLEKLAGLIAESPGAEIDGITSTDDEAAHPSTLAVLCRTNGQALSIAEKLYGRDESAPATPIQVSAGSPSKSVPAWIGATLGRFRSDSLSKSNFKKIYTTLYGSRTAERHSLYVPDLDNAWEMLKIAANSARGQEAVSIRTLRDRLTWPDLLPDDEGVPNSSIEVTTIHQSKGLEYDDVRLVEADRDANCVRDAGESDDVGLLEEANILFVALSRAGRSFERLEWAGAKYLYPKQFGPNEHTRWCNWRKDGGRLEIGLSCDVSPTSFVSTEIHESAEAAGETQAWLAENIATLRGHKVVLVKMLIPGSSNKFIYYIYLQEDSKPTKLLGCTRQQLTFDLLSVLKIYGKGKKYVLPNNIFNLRIADVISMAGTGDVLKSVHEPWKQSGLWVGVKIHGLGFFKTWVGRS